MTIRERRFDVVSAEHLEKLASQPLPLRSRGPAPSRVHYRDLYIDTDDDQLQRRGFTCRLRVGSDDRRTLTVLRRPPRPTAFRSDGSTRRYCPPIRASRWRSNTEPARRLAAVVDFRLLQTRLELQIERGERRALPDWLGRPRLLLHYDRVHVHSGTSSRAFHQLSVRSQRLGEADFERFCAELQDRAGLRPIVAGTRERAQLLLKWMQREERGRARMSDAGVALVLTRASQVATPETGRGALPAFRGRDGCRCRAHAAGPMRSRSRFRYAFARTTQFHRPDAHSGSVDRRAGAA